jgi:hypothetical protein
VLTNTFGYVTKGRSNGKEFIMKKIVIGVISLFFVAGACLADEQPTRTLYNNKIPYEAFFASHNPNLIKVQVGNKQAVIPVVNDTEKDLTQKEEKKGK